MYSINSTLNRVIPNVWFKGTSLYVLEGSDIAKEQIDLLDFRDSQATIKLGTKIIFCQQNYFSLLGSRSTLILWKYLFDNELLLITLYVKFYQTFATLIHINVITLIRENKANYNSISYCIALFELIRVGQWLLWLKIKGIKQMIS